MRGMGWSSSHCTYVGAHARFLHAHIGTDSGEVPMCTGAPWVRARNPGYSLPDDLRYPAGHRSGSWPTENREAVPGGATSPRWSDPVPCCKARNTRNWRVVGGGDAVSRAIEGWVKGRGGCRIAAHLAETFGHFG